MSIHNACFSHICYLFKISVFPKVMEVYREPRHADAVRKCKNVCAAPARLAAVCHQHCLIQHF